MTLETNQSIDPYLVDTGIFRGREHVYVTHLETGKQWVSKSPKMPGDGSFCTTSDLIATGILKFDPKKIIGSCDTRFWELVQNSVPAPRNDFDALCFVGD